LHHDGTHEVDPRRTATASTMLLLSVRTASELQNWKKVSNQFGNLRRTDRREKRSSSMPNKRIRIHRYSIDIRDAKGQSVFFAAADWNDDERRAAIAQILRLEGVPDVHDFSEPKIEPKRGKE
jgi:hypothetical protein